MSGRDHRKLRLSSRKNYERKKYRTAPLTLLVSIPRTVVSASVPQEHPSQSLSVVAYLHVSRCATGYGTNTEDQTAAVKGLTLR